MKIVGFHDGHDVSYSILENGVPIIHEELERFNRKKMSYGDGLQMFFDHNKETDIKYFTHGNPGGRHHMINKNLGEELMNHIK